MIRKLFAAMICTVVATSVTGPAQAQYGGGGYNQGYNEHHNQGYNEHRRNRGYSERHYSWCEDRYNSYNRASNSYWTQSGRQRQCQSPYM